MTRTWHDCLFRLHRLGWNSDDIDEGCEALHEACTEGTFEGSRIEELTVEQVRSVLSANLELEALTSLQQLAVVRRQQDAESDDLRRALYDLDAFADRLSHDE